MIIVLLCQGLIFETSSSTEANASLVSFTVLVLLMLIGTLLLTASNTGRRYRNKNSTKHIPSVAIPHLSQNAIGELFYVNSCIHMEKVGVIEIPLNKVRQKLSSVQVQEVRRLAEMYGTLDPVEFVQAMQKVFMGQRLSQIAKPDEESEGNDALSKSFSTHMTHSIARPSSARHTTTVGSTRNLTASSVVAF
jgi:hypothetical protein